MADNKCISSEYKTTLENLIGNVSNKVLIDLVNNVWKSCDGSVSPAPSSSSGSSGSGFSNDGIDKEKCESRDLSIKGQKCNQWHIPKDKAGNQIGPGKCIDRKLWQPAIYYGKDGKAIKGSFSGLFEQIVGVPVTTDKVCSLVEGHADCRALSTIENWRNRGFIIKGDGDDPPVPAGKISGESMETLYDKWKKKMCLEDKTINIYHPEFPGIKQATEYAERTITPRSGPVNTGSGIPGVTFAPPSAPPEEYDWLKPSGGIG
jgi:hypothetical protein